MRLFKFETVEITVINLKTLTGEVIYPPFRIFREKNKNLQYNVTKNLGTINRRFAKIFHEYNNL